MLIEALHYEKLKDGLVRCKLCGHNCLIRTGKRGICNVRENIGGTLFSLNSKRIVAASNDPIEKKPLYHFFPGSFSYSVACVGCNFKCGFCQNHTISQVDDVFGEEIEFEDIVKSALKEKSKSISFTYSEPTVFYELVKGVSLISKRYDIKNVIVSNGFMEDNVAKEMASFINAANIDLKFFKDESYKRYTGGNLEKVKSSIEIFVKEGVWVEITTLIIPGVNDSESELNELSSWIASLSRDIPWHISRFFPQYKMLDKDITPADKIILAYEIGKKNGLNFVYTGNIRLDSEYESTFCPYCGKLLIERNGFFLTKNDIIKGSCPNCGKSIAGRWE